MNFPLFASWHGLVIQDAYPGDKNDLYARAGLMAVCKQIIEARLTAEEVAHG
jgi:hypothetical protein